MGRLKPPLRILQNAIVCSRLTLLSNRTNTRYGRAANPHPTGTFTPQETPSLARRDNDRAKAARATDDLANYLDACGARSHLRRMLEHYLNLAIGFGPSGASTPLLLPENFAKYIGSLSCNPNQ